MWAEFRETSKPGILGLPPDILLVHLGNNHLTECCGKAIILDVLRDLQEWKCRYTEIRLVWSTVVPCYVWRVECDPHCLNQARRKVNREVCRATCQGLGSLISHPNINWDTPQLYRGDGVHLSDQAMEIFLTDFKWDLRVEVFCLMGKMEHS